MLSVWIRKLMKEMDGVIVAFAARIIIFVVLAFNNFDEIWSKLILEVSEVIQDHKLKTQII